MRTTEIRRKINTTEKRSAVTWDCAHKQICLYAFGEEKMNMHPHALCTPSLSPHCCMFSFPLNSPRSSLTATPQNYRSYAQPNNPILRICAHSRFSHDYTSGPCNSMNASIGWSTGFLMEVGLSFPLHNQNSGVKSRQRSSCLKIVSSSDQSMHTFRKNRPQDINVLVVGSTGYIGKFVVKELVKRGYNVIAIAREKSGIRGRIGKEKTIEELKGAQVCFAEVTDLLSLRRTMEDLGVSVDVVVSCLATRSGGVKDSWKIEYEATKNSLIVGKSAGAKHFVLLSAICVQKPLLEFQRAKLKFEAELQRESENGRLTYSIVRPTAFFKSLGGQVELVRTGKPYVMFGDGKLCACKPISEADLASFIADCVTADDKINKILPIGGPGKALTPLEQGEILFRIMGKEPKFLKVPIGIMDFAIGLLSFLVKFFPSLEDAAEYGKIGRYYASESMLGLDPETGEYDADATPSYGKDTLEEFFERVLREGMAGQELGEQAIF